MKFKDLQIGDKFESDGLIFQKIRDKDTTDKGSKGGNSICNQTLTGIRRVPCTVPMDCEVVKIDEK